MKVIWKTTVLFSLVLILAVATLLGQESDLRQEEIEDYYKKWLREDVVYIIDPSELSVFNSLTTPEEKDQFIEQFWRRRDPNPLTLENEFKEEHYRRIAYANEKFHSGVPGWKTDRGWVYIKFGPPTGTEKHPEGGFYARKHHEGGGFTATYPFEVWFYNYLPGVGEGVEIEFVDPSKSNEYRIAMNPDEKDALFNVPGAGLTLDEMYGSTTRLDRRRFQNMANDVGYFRYRRVQDMPFQRLQRLYDLQQAPPIQFDDLEKLVNVNISYQQLPLEIRVDHLQISKEIALIPVTIFVQNKELTFQPVSDDISRATLEIYGRVDSVQGQTEYIFEDTVKKEVKEEARKGEMESATLYQKRFPLKAGRYKLSLVIKEVATGKLRTLDRLILVKSHDESALYCSSALLSPRVEEIPPGGSPADPFALTHYVVRPVEDNEFKVADAFVQSYFEVYNLGVDQTTLEASATVEISLHKSSGSGRPKVIFPYTAIQDEYKFAVDRLLVFKTIPFAGLSPGNYTVWFRIFDQVNQQSVEQKVDFKIVG
jgi:GWxTD domain-containing protein